MQRAERRPDDALARVRLGDEDRRALDAAERDDDARVGRRRLVADRQRHREEVLGLDRAVGCRAGRPVGLDEQRVDAVRRRSAGASAARGRGRARPSSTYGDPSAVSVRATGPSHSSAPLASWIVSSGAGRKPFSWNVKPATASGSFTRIDLAGEELAVAVDGEIGREVRRLAARQPGRLEPEALDDEQAGRPDRLDRRRCRRRPPRAPPPRRAGS